MKILIIPDRSNLQESLRLASEYGTGFEYNDFFHPDVLDDEAAVENTVNEYKSNPLPEYCTLHGAFFDVIPFSPDRKIREISDLRIRQSIEAARKIGAKAVIFHTNYNPFLNAPEYLGGWFDKNEKYWSKILSANPDMKIYLENMFDTSPYILKELAERLCRFENFGVCFDYAHAALTKVPLAQWAETLCKYVRHMHINDNDLVSDLHLAVGDGKINWKEFYRLYEKFLANIPVLVETSFLERQRASLERLKADGFIN